MLRYRLFNYREFWELLISYGGFLLILGIVCAVKLQKIKYMSHNIYPGIDRNKFETWKGLYVSSLKIFFFSNLGTLIVHFPSHVFNSKLAGYIFIPWLLGISIGAGYGSKAKKVQKELGIAWPPLMNTQ